MYPGVSRWGPGEGAAGWSCGENRFGVNLHQRVMRKLQESQVIDEQVVEDVDADVELLLTEEALVEERLLMLVCEAF